MMINNDIISNNNLITLGRTIVKIFLIFPKDKKRQIIFPTDCLLSDQEGRDPVVGEPGPQHHRRDLHCDHRHPDLPAQRTTDR